MTEHTDETARPGCDGRSHALDCNNALYAHRPWVAPRSGGYQAPGPERANPRPPSGPGAVEVRRG